MVPNGRTRGHGPKLQHKKFHLNVRQNFFPLEGGRALAQLPGEAVGSPSLQTFTSRLDVTLCDLLWVTLLWQGRGQMGSRGPFDPDQFDIL